MLPSGLLWFDIRFCPCIDSESKWFGLVGLFFYIVKTADCIDMCCWWKIPPEYCTIVLVTTAALDVSNELIKCSE
jgi:hypothetical protein